MKFTILALTLCVLCVSGTPTELVEPKDSKQLCWVTLLCRISNIGCPACYRQTSVAPAPVPASLTNCAMKCLPGHSDSMCTIDTTNDVVHCASNGITYNNRCIYTCMRNFCEPTLTLRGCTSSCSLPIIANTC